MVNSKNSLNLKNYKNTPKKSIVYRRQLDGIIKKENFSSRNIPTGNSASPKKENNESKDKKIILNTETTEDLEKSSVDDGKRLFLKIAGVAGLGLAASALLPKSADAYVSGSTPTSNVVGIKSLDNTRINPATVEGQGVLKGTASLSSSGTVKTPTSGKKLRIYATRFSLTADASLVSFRFTSGGTDYEKYVSPKTGGLYGSNNHPNYVEGGINEVLYCSISGTTTVQINFDYLEV